MGGSGSGRLRARGRLWSSEEFSLQRSLSDKVLGGEEVPPLSWEGPGLSGSSVRARSVPCAQPGPRCRCWWELGWAQQSCQYIPPLSAAHRRLPGCEFTPSPSTGPPCRAQRVPLEGEGCAPLPGEVFSALGAALSGADGTGRLSSAGARRMRAARGGSGGSSSPWKLWQPGACSPAELGVRQPNP